MERFYGRIARVARALVDLWRINGVHTYRKLRELLLFDREIIPRHIAPDERGVAVSRKNSLREIMRLRRRIVSGNGFGWRIESRNTREMSYVSRDPIKLSRNTLNKADYHGAGTFHCDKTWIRPGGNMYMRLIKYEPRVPG